MEIKELAVIGGGIFILLVLLIMLKVQNQKTQAFLNSAKRDPGGEDSGRRNVHGQTVEVAKLQDGDILGEDVSDPAGKVILLEQGTRLTAQNIDKLRNWDVPAVRLQ